MLNILANAKAVVNFENSDGCILNFPKENQEVAPPVESVLNSTAINAIIIIP